MMKRQTCRCGAVEGQIHGVLCSLEYCPQCDKQRLWMCRCGPDADRSPFISYPLICARCGELWPELFGVPDKEWEDYVEPSKRREILCRPCFDQMKAWTDEADYSSPDDVAEGSSSNQGPSIAEACK